MYVIYVDGSYNIKKNACGYGLVITKDDISIYEEYKTINHDAVKMRNVLGEIVGSCRAMELALKHNIKEITIAFDYEGIEKWAIGAWKAKNEHTQAYAKYAQYIMSKIKVNFLKIKAHTGVEFNERADTLAKMGALFE